MNRPLSYFSAWCRSKVAQAGPRTSGHLQNPYAATMTTWPGFREASKASIFGTRGRVWITRMLAVWSPTTAGAKRGMFCWKDTLRSPVRKTWKWAWASVRKRPFFSWTVLTSSPGSSRASRQSRHSSATPSLQATARSFSVAASRKGINCSRPTVGKAASKASMDSPPSKSLTRFGTRTRVPVNH